jgi:hypothetical protein
VFWFVLLLVPIAPVLLCSGLVSGARLMSEEMGFDSSTLILVNKVRS